MPDRYGLAAGSVVVIVAVLRPRSDRSIVVALDLVPSPVAVATAVVVAAVAVAVAGVAR